MSGLVRQHLIDPEICIRCETCAEMCQQDAISYDGVNVVVDYSVCTYSMDCIAPCPTGAIDSWVMVESPFSTAEQFGWDELPAVSTGDKEDAEIVEAVDNEVSDMLRAAHAGLGGETRRQVDQQLQRSGMVMVPQQIDPPTATTIGPKSHECDCL